MTLQVSSTVHDGSPSRGDKGHQQHCIHVLLCCTICAVQALEAALPPTTSQFMHLVGAHAAAGQEHSFATCQLLQLAAICMVKLLHAAAAAASLEQSCFESMLL